MEECQGAERAGGSVGREWDREKQGALVFYSVTLNIAIRIFPFFLMLPLKLNYITGTQLLEAKY